MERIPGNRAPVDPTETLPNLEAYRERARVSHKEETPVRGVFLIDTHVGFGLSLTLGLVLDLILGFGPHDAIDAVGSRSRDS